MNQNDPSDKDLLDQLVAAVESKDKAKFELLYKEALIRMAERTAMKSRAAEIIKQCGTQHPRALGVMQVQNAADRARGKGVTGVQQVPK